jgi:hypothetical protein
LEWVESEGRHMINYVVVQSSNRKLGQNGLERETCTEYKLNRRQSTQTGKNRKHEIETAKQQSFKAAQFPANKKSFQRI